MDISLARCAGGHLYNNISSHLFVKVSDDMYTNICMYTYIYIYIYIDE